MEEILVLSHSALTSRDFWISSVYLEEGVVLFWLLVRSLVFNSSSAPSLHLQWRVFQSYSSYYLWIATGGNNASSFVP